jgi:hypothetical protein
MSSTCGHENEELVKHVLRYFLHNPQSADSLEGVARWRLLEETIHRTLTETRSALERLVAEGYLQVVSVPGSDQIYTLNPTKREEAERFLGQAEPPMGPKQ